VGRISACRRRLSRPEDEAPRDAIAVEHGGDPILEDHGDGLARVLAPDGALVAAELDVAAAIKGRA